MSPLSRRQVIRATTASALGLAVPRISSADSANPVQKDLIFVCLRGGADGLSIAVPYGDPLYYKARPLTSIERPDSSCPGRAIDLDGTFGLHPGLSMLKPLYDAKELALVVGVGSQARTGSHHVARKSLDDALQHANRGKVPAVVSGTLGEQFAAIVEQARTGKLARATVVEALGWDTHAMQGNGARGHLKERLSELGAALAGLKVGLGTAFSKVLVVVVTEFGRSVFETPTEGTDDGHASVLLLLGRNPGWGKVFGRMPSLECSALSEGRHLKPTTDLANALYQVAQGNWP